jgi:hypothetical protein
MNTNYTKLIQISISLCDHVDEHNTEIGVVARRQLPVVVAEIRRIEEEIHSDLA